MQRRSFVVSLSFSTFVLAELALVIASLISHRIGRQVALQWKARRQRQDGTNSFEDRQQLRTFLSNIATPRRILREEWQPPLEREHTPLFTEDALFFTGTTIDEAFVHPALLTHSHPKKVALLTTINNSEHWCSMVEQIRLHHTVVESISVVRWLGWWADDDPDSSSDYACLPLSQFAPLPVELQILELPSCTTLTKRRSMLPCRDCNRIKV